MAMHPFLLNWFTRYAFVVDFIREKRLPARARVLEVGSGSFGLGAFIGKRVVGVDSYFEQERHALLIRVRGHAGQLPFRDGSFELVVSLDLIEHVPSECRAEVIADMFRLSSSLLIIGCPIGKTAESCDRAFAAWLRRAGKQVPWWVSEHFERGVPTELEMLSAIKSIPSVGRVEVFPNENTAVHMAAIVADHTPEVLEALMPSLNEYRDEWLRLCSRVSFGDCYRQFFVVRRGE